jgi:hypothetical protein
VNGPTRDYRPYDATRVTEPARHFGLKSSQIPTLPMNSFPPPARRLFPPILSWKERCLEWLKQAPPAPTEYPLGFDYLLRRLEAIANEVTEESEGTVSIASSSDYESISTEIPTISIRLPVCMIEKTINGQTVFVESTDFREQIAIIASC